MTEQMNGGALQDLSNAMMSQSLLVQPMSQSLHCQQLQGINTFFWSLRSPWFREA